MDQNERIRLKKQYEQYADTQVLLMLEDGPGAFVAGAYVLLQEEALRRGISLQSRPQQPEPDTSEPPESLPADEITQSQAFVEIMVINHDGDQQLVVSRLEQTDIPYHFMKISVVARDYPVALMVDQLRIEEAIKQLRQLVLTASIVLW